MVIKIRTSLIVDGKQYHLIGTPNTKMVEVYDEKKEYLIEIPGVQIPRDIETIKTAIIRQIKELK